MAKTSIVGVFSSPLDGILGTRAKVGVLRVLSGAPAPLGMREISRRSGMAYRSIELAIKELVILGILERIDGSRERLLRISATHRLAPALEALLRAEEDYLPALRSELKALATRGLQDGLLAAALIGKGVRSEEGLGDPLELLILSVDPAGAARWKKAFELAGVGLLRRFGVTLSVVSYDLGHARRLWQTRTPAAERSIREADSLAGEPMAALLASQG